MAAGRSLRSLVSRRRRAEEDGEDEEEGPVVVEDSQSEGSVLSDGDDDEADGSSLGNAANADAGADNPEQEAAAIAPSASRTRPPRKPRKKSSKSSKENVQDTPQFKAMADTQAMMNGLDINQQSQSQAALDFEKTDTPTAAGAVNGHEISLAEKQRREHEDYKRKRDSNPAFIPNRGNFFMHDTRGQPNGQAPPLRGVWQSRGRGRGAASVGGPFSPANRMAQAERAAEQPWKHDLHDTINEEPQTTLQNARLPNHAQQDQNHLAQPFQQPAAYGQAPPRSFSSTTLVGKVQIRVWFPGMKAPAVFSEVPWKHYTRLPDHRPPLRRDKPVRVFLPGHPQQFIFPSPERSFIFIPRQNRPNPSGFHRGNYQRSIGGYGYSSRRTSMYGGSVYSPSVAASRRSSLAGISRENAFSPVGSINGMMHRPVVKLPYGSQPYSGVSTPVGPLSGHQTPTGLPQMHSYPPPQQPTHYGTAMTTVYHPRPQKGKAISIDGIESPIVQQEPQPFQNQLPAHMNEAPAPYFSPQPMLPPSQPQSGTPLVGIPEQAIHAPSFQSPAYGQPAYYVPYPPPQNMYYAAPVASPYPPPPSMYMQPHHQYMVPPPGQMVAAHPPPQQQQHQHPISLPPQPAPSQPTEEQNQRSTQSGMVAHESNGMVYYHPASEAQQSEQYQPAESFVPSYAMPGLPPPTPPGETSTYYYPSGMHEVGTAMYYPAQPGP